MNEGRVASDLPLLASSLDAPRGAPYPASFGFDEKRDDFRRLQALGPPHSLSPFLPPFLGKPGLERELGREPGSVPDVLSAKPTRDQS